MTDRRMNRCETGKRFWGAHINAWSRSGLSIAEYCRRQGLSYHAFRYWKQKLDHGTVGSQVSLVEIGRIGCTSRAGSGRDRNFSLRIRIDDRCTIEVGDGFSSSTLSRLLSVMGDRDDLRA